MIFVLPNLFSKVIRGVGEQRSRAWCFAPFTGGKGGIEQSWFLSLSQASLAHTLTATRSHQDTQTHLAGAGSLMGSTEDKEPYWVFTSSFGFLLSGSDQLVVRENWFQLPVKNQVQNCIYCHKSWARLLKSVFAPFCWESLCLQSYLPVGITPRGVAVGCGNSVIIPLPEYFCLLLRNHICCGLICLWALWQKE